MARTVRAMWWGRKRKIELLHRMGLKAPGGRPRSLARLQELQRQASALLRAEIDRIEEWLRRIEEEKARADKAGSES